MRSCLYGLLGLAISAVPFPAAAHIGSPDVFYNGRCGPYPISVTIRVPPVVPGRAAIEVRTSARAVQEVLFQPVYCSARVKENPPPEAAVPVAGAPGSYHGELWLMRSGGYSINLTLKGKEGDGALPIPVNSVATRQLAMPFWLGPLLAFLGGTLFFGAILIVRAAASESTLNPGAPLDPARRRKGTVAAVASAVILTLGVIGGRVWWKSEEAGFRRGLREGAWPDLALDVQPGAPSVLYITLGPKAFGPNADVPLALDHGKLLHVFLIGETAFAHIHPVHLTGTRYAVVLPLLPPGDYQFYADLTLERNALSSTASGRVRIPTAAHDTNSPPPEIAQDPDDSWALCPMSADGSAEGDAAFPFEDGLQLVWQSHPAARARHDAGLAFELRNAAGKPSPITPYMGMLCHAAVLREDGLVFAHLHPDGNFSMAAQMLFEGKLMNEGGPAPMDHSVMHHAHAPADATSFSLPYEFPAPGNYRVWVQFKSGEVVHTALFRVTATGA